MQKGSRAKLIGLQDPSLNGKAVNVVKFCKDTKRWAVQLGDRTLAVKESNLVLWNRSNHTEIKTLRLCRYGNSCWRPNCCFSHPCEHERAQNWALHWDSVIKESAANENVRLDFKIPEAESGRNSGLGNVTDIDCDTTCAPAAAAPQRLILLEQEMKKLEDSIEASRRAVDYQLAVHDEQLGRALDVRMLGALEHAIVPMAETVVAKMLIVEARIDSCESSSRRDFSRAFKTCFSTCAALCFVFLYLMWPSLVETLSCTLVQLLLLVTLCLLYVYKRTAFRREPSWFMRSYSG